MASSNENINPRSLPNFSNLPTHSAPKYPKNNKISHSLKVSSLQNVALGTFNDVQDDQEKQKQLPTPPCSRSNEQTRFPISPPPEEELRVMELSAHAQSPRVFQSQSHIPVHPRPDASKLPGLLQSFANFQQQHYSHDISPDVNEPSAPRSNSRKRARSLFPSIPNSSSSKSLPSEAKPAAAASSPNPKPRKQLKLYETGKRRYISEASLDGSNESNMVKSPIQTKRRDPGLEDYTPQHEHQTTASRRNTHGRRSTTPDVRYEAPAEQFTPPRSVVLDVPSSIASVRSRSVKPPSSSKNGTKPSIERKVVTVKAERFTSPFPLPPVDLSKPVPPPSPTDDPLLLVGVDEPPRLCDTPVSKRTLVDVAVGANLDDNNPPSTPIRYRSPSVIHEMNQSHWNFGSNVPEQTALMDVDFDVPSNFEATFNPGFDSDDDDNDNMANIDNGVFTRPHVTQFDPNETADSHIFHSDDAEAQAGEDEGEFTGRFKFYNTPLKQDPPSSATRMRRESWGRPISPFPFSLSAGVLEEDEELGEFVQDVLLPLSPSPKERHRTSIASRRSGHTLSEMEAILESRIAKQDMLADNPVGAKPDQLSVVEERNKGLFGRNLSSASKHVDSDEQESNSSGNELCDEEEAVAVEREITPFDGSKDDNDVREISDNGSNVDPPAGLEVCEDSQSSIDDGNFLRDSYLRHKPALFADFAVAVADGDTSYPFHDDDTSDDDLFPTNVVEVSSRDPRAAARAAAILKLHHAYVLDGDIAKRSRRHSAYSVSRRASSSPGNAESRTEDTIRRARRKCVSSGGGVLQFKPRETGHSPSSQTAFLAPLSPAVSSKDALEEAETEIRARSASPMRMVTPVHSMTLQGEITTPLPTEMSCHEESQQPAAWSKVHWKMLDTCFTDERLAVGKTMGLNGQMASVDDVALDAIVQRFLEENEDGATWDRQILLRRVQALSTRQRAGRGAPPSPRNKVALDSTPTSVLRAPVPPSESDIPVKFPSTLLAPRYAHLLEEAKAIRASVSSTTVDSVAVSSTPVSEDTSEDVTSPVTASLVPVGTITQGDSDNVDVPASSTKKVLNYLGSFLGRANNNVASRRPMLQPSFSTALPLPLPEVRQIPRGPISTPAKKPPSKSQAPRELVHLTEVQPAIKQVEFPKTKSVRDMVALNHIEPPRSVQRPRTVSGPIVIPGRERRDSGSSVKDLIESFEEVRKKTEEDMKKAKSRPTIRKLASVSNLAGSRPIWRP